MYPPPNEGDIRIIWYCFSHEDDEGTIYANNKPPTYDFYEESWHHGPGSAGTYGDYRNCWTPESTYGLARGGGVPKDDIEILQHYSDNRTVGIPMKGYALYKKGKWRYL